MAAYQVEASAQIPAPPQQVYAIIADYRNGHPHILPKKYFKSLEVEKGGVGAGTRIRFQMRVLGQTREMRAVITEPEPGRVLVESDLAAKIFTTFTVDPAESGACRVTFRTELPLREGLAGKIEKFVTTTFLKRIYKLELAQLADFAQKS